MSGSSDGVGPGSGVLWASSTLCASLLALLTSEYPSGRDHQLRHAQVFAAASAFGFGGSGGNGGSSMSGMEAWSALAGVSWGAAFGGSSTRPSEETLTCVIEAGIVLPLLDLRLVRNRLGESSCGFFASSPGSSPVAPALTPILSFAVLTMAGALDRQLPVPVSHFLPFGVCVPGVAGGVSVLAVAVEAAIEVSEAPSCRTELALGVLERVFAAVTSGGSSRPELLLLVLSAGAWGAGVLGRDFLRGFMPTRRGGE